MKQRLSSRLELDSVPDEIDDLQRKVRQLEIEKEVVKRDNDPNKLDNISKLLADAKERLNTSHWLAK